MQRYLPPWLVRTKTKRKDAERNPVFMNRGTDTITRKKQETLSITKVLRNRSDGTPVVSSVPLTFIQRPGSGRARVLWTHTKVASERHDTGTSTTN